MGSEEFRTGMRKLAGGVTIVTSIDQEAAECRPHGNRCVFAFNQDHLRL